MYFCSQFPDDVPNEILGQLGNRVQHALRAYTPRDQKAVRDLEPAKRERRRARGRAEARIGRVPRRDRLLESSRPLRSRGLNWAGRWASDLLWGTKRRQASSAVSSADRVEASVRR